MASERFEDWFDNGEEVEKLMEAADRAARSPFDRTFIDNLYEKFEKYGMQTYLSYSQHKQFMRIAER